MKQRTRLMHSGDDLMGHNMYHAKTEDDDGEIQLHRIRPQEHFIEAQVQEGDTLQAIALRFYCSTSELKRINHIHKDNEIFARRTIKVPVTPYSVLTELLPTNNTSEPQPSTSNHTNILLQNTSENYTELKNVSDFEIDCNAVVMNSTIAPSIVPYTDAEPNESLSEDTQLLPNKERVPVETVVVKQLTAQGADWGLKWFHLVGFILVLGVVIPLYVFMYLYHPAHHTEVKPAL